MPRFEVRHPKFVAVIIERGPEQRKVFAAEDLDIREAPGAWNLLGQDAV
jgi:hypothetical protein